MPIKGLKGGIGTKALGYGLGAAEEATEPNFNKTVLLIHSDGSEGAGNTAALGTQNYKAFRDNSTSAHVITVEGDAYGNDFSPYYYADGYWSNSFDGADDSIINTNTSSDFNLGTGQFTFEAFINTQITTQQTVMIATGGGTDFNIYINGGKLYMYFGSNIINGVGTINVNEWHHIVVLRDSSDYLTAYVDGTRVYYTTQTTDYTAHNKIKIGEHTNNTNDFNGYISNVRFVANTAVYSGASITVPTTPLTAITNTKLLTCQSNRFVDNSTSSHALTIGGDLAVSTNTPFTVTKTANVGSGFFDGTNDYLTVAQSTDFLFGTNAFSIEFWWYPLSLGNTGFYTLETTGGITFYYSGSALNLDTRGGSNIITSANDPILNQWNHIVVTRSGTGANEGAIFLNGTRVAQGTISDNFTTNATLEIGEISGIGSYDLDGYLSDYRVVNGSNVYDPASSSITVPTSSLTSTGSETKLLTCQYSGAVRNVGFDDESKYNHRIVRNGDTTMGTFSPFSLEDGYWSNYFSGNHPIEIADSGSVLDLSGDFTIEFWAFEPKIATAGGTVNMYFTIDTLDRFQFSNNGSNIILYINGSSAFSSTTAPLDQWNHIAIVREGSGSNNLSFYLNGARQTQATNTYSIAAASMMLGGQDRGSATGYHGSFMYMSNFRILKGTALYSGTSITVPTEPLTAITNTSLLTCQSNRFIDNSTNNLTLTRSASSPTKIIPFSPFAPSRSYSKDAVGGSAYFDGSGDSLKIEPQNDKDVFNPTTTYTLEGWVYVDVDAPGTSYFLTKGGTATGWSGTTGHYLIMFYYSNSVYIQIKTGSGSFFGLSGAHGASYQWNHFAVGYDGTTTRFWWNGETINSTTTTPEADTDTDEQNLFLGVSNDGSSNRWSGYISNVRYVRGTDIYGVSNTSITVPTSPPTAVTNTNFLTTFTNAGIIDHTMKNVLRTVGDTRIITTDKKLGTGSLVFDGNDYLEAVNTEDRELFTPETGDMTWEMFVKFDILDGNHTLFGKYGSGSEYYFYWENGSTRWNLTYHASQFTWSDTISTGTWYHIAVVKDGGTVYVFKDGTSLGTNSATYNTTQTGRNFVLGTSFNGPNSALYQLKGKLDEVRVTRVARYTSNFTAPTRAFANR